MTGNARLVATLAIFATMLVLVIVRPPRWNEAWWTVLAAVAMLAVGLVSPRQALDAIGAGKSALLFLLSLLSLSLLIGKSGFFDWAAIRCARLADGDARSLYRNAFFLGAAVTALLSLDTTAVILLPVLLVIVQRLKLPPTPYIVLCAFVANVGSLVLPISNLTNILFADAFHLTFAAFAARMIVPQLVALAVTYALLRWHFRRELPRQFAGAASLPEPSSVVPRRAYFRICLAVLGAVLIGYFVAPLIGIEPYVVAFAGVALLIVAGAATGQVRPRAVRELSWSVFPFVAGLFVAVRGLENLGLVDVSSRWLAHLRPGSPPRWMAVAGATALASNVVNNLPAALIARSVLSTAHAHTGTVLSALIGADVGPLITPFGSLATMLVLALARRQGVDVRAGRLLIFGMWATPIIVIATTLTLTAVFLVSH